jgi:hypothetical protein
LEGRKGGEDDAHKDTKPVFDWNMNITSWRDIFLPKFKLEDKKDDVVSVPPKDKGTYCLFF